MSSEPTYSFLPWLRQGIANNIINSDDDDNTHLRARIPVQLKVEGTNPQNTAIAPLLVNKNIELYGPGDIVGIDKKVIIKCEPKHWITNFEPNYLPYIDFYEEDFPWRYTPAKAAGNRLRPWLTLVVLEDKEFENGRNMAKKPLPYFSLKSGVKTVDIFPKPSELWAWAHVHFNTELPDKPDVSAEVSQIISTTPDLAYSRIVSPRKLKPNVGYHAFLVPSFESGRLAGLGIDQPSTLSATQVAWDDVNCCDFPYYHRWYFRTGAVGDFEYLVGLLKPKPAHHTVGYRAMDVLHPGSNLSPVLNPDLAGILRLGGALRVPSNNLKGDDQLLLERENNWRNLYAEKFPQDMANRVNLADNYTDENKTIVESNTLASIKIQVSDETVVKEEVDPDPVVTSPLYGQWHALQKRLLVERNGQQIPYPNNWVHELNLDPRYRVAAGIGTKVLQNNQERYMQAAWEQVGDIMEANRKILFGQLAKEVSNHLFNTKIVPHIDTDSLLIAAPLLKRLMMDSVTINHKFQNSTLPLAATSANFRKLISPKSVIIQKNKNVKGNVLLSKLVTKEIVVDTPIMEPTGALLLERTLNNIKTADLKTFDFSVINKFRPQLVVKPQINTPIILHNLNIPLVMRSDPAKLAASLTSLAKDNKLNVLMDNLSLDLKLNVEAQLFKPYPNRLSDIEINRIQPQLSKIDTILLSNDINKSFNEIPKISNFVIQELGKAVDFKVGRIDSNEVLRFKEALRDNMLNTKADFVEIVREKPNITNIVSQIKVELNPSKTISKFIFDQIKFPNYIAPIFIETFAPVLVYPVIDEPMYKPLSDLSKEYFLPNIDKIEENSITLLENNQKFIEAYMVGVNHEMSRELLWREYPTDQRGSYFRQFWDVNSYIKTENPTEAERDKLRDISPIHLWSKLDNRPLMNGKPLPLRHELGTHNKRIADGDPSLVLVVRGELLKKYPNTVVYAHKAAWGIKNGQPNITVDRELAELTAAQFTEPPESIIKLPLFEAKVDPDIYFFGFDLTADESDGTANPQNITDDPGWFFVLKERPGEPRFGLDEDKASEIINWNNLSWKDVGTVDGNCIQLNKTIKLSKQTQGQENLVEPQDVQVDRWASDTDSAELAYILYQVPVLVAIHAKRLLPK